MVEQEVLEEAVQHQDAHGIMHLQREVLEEEVEEETAEPEEA